ncbi:DNA/RNA helicase, superfamily I [Candidatus Magnetoovum chiemensis]|nr:DNA/RNA helicase, superfamily I [Candidatus Magnetoovum chiemensis]
MNFTVRDFLYAKTTYGLHTAFDGVCNEILDVIRNRDVRPLYDALIIDEAQDLPASFFKIVYNFVTDEKRIIWAYDELQNLSYYSMPPVEELFGKNSDGQPNVRLSNNNGEPRQDIILPICYRNTPWALTIAHALGFGTNREDGLAQLFDDDSIWNEIGYTCIEGDSFTPNKKVVLKRRTNSYPVYFNELLSPEDSIECYCFSSFYEEAEWIADQIFKNLNDEDLDHDDILIILPDEITAKNKANIIEKALEKQGIESHLVGVTNSADEVFRPRSVAIANIYRAKGNEAPVVYVANSDHCYRGFHLSKLRNTLFTAITRSRAWVRLTGSGDDMKKIEKEFKKVQNDKYTLNFILPNKEERRKLHTIHRERTDAEKNELKQLERALTKLTSLSDKDDIDPSIFSIDTIKALERFLKKNKIYTEDV